MATDLSTRLVQLRTEAGDRAALICVDRLGNEQVLAWRDLERLSAERAVELPPAPMAIMVPVDSSPAALVELVAVLRSGRVAVVVDKAVGRSQLESVAVGAAQRLQLPVWYGDAVLAGSDGTPAHASGAVLMTGGTSGQVKFVLRPGVPSWDPVRGAPLLYQRTGWRPGQVQLLAGGWYHAAPYTHLIDGLLSGNTMVTTQLFDPQVVLATMARHQPDWAQLTPTHLQLLAPGLTDWPDALRGLAGVLHTAGPCADRTRETWISAIGPERLWEMYAATEGIGVTLCRADEWQARRGTVGRGFLTRLRIYDEETGTVLPPGETGTVYMKRLGAGPVVQGQVGHQGRDGYRTVGDLGYLDEDGYLYLVGRADDMVIIGGENVHLQTVTSTLLRYPAVEDAAVIAVDDPILGQRLVALVVSNSDQDIRLALLQHCLSQVSSREVPGEIHLVESLPRTAAGKLRREDLLSLAGAGRERS